MSTLLSVTQVPKVVKALVLVTLMMGAKGACAQNAQLFQDKPIRFFTAGAGLGADVQIRLLSKMMSLYRLGLSGHGFATQAAFGMA